MTTARTFEIVMTSSGPSGESRVITAAQAADALIVLRDVIPAMGTVEEPEEIAIRIRLVQAEGDFTSN